MAFRNNAEKVRDGLTIFERQFPYPANHSVYYSIIYHNGKEFQRTTKIRVDGDVSKYKAGEAAKKIQDKIVKEIDGGYTHIPFENAIDIYMETQWKKHNDPSREVMTRLYQRERQLTQNTLPFFKKYIREISDDDIAIYRSERLGTGISPATMNVELTWLRGVFKSVCPKFMREKDIPIIRNEKTNGGNTRYDFTTQEVRKMIKSVWDERKHHHHPERVDNWFHFYTWLMLFVATGIALAHCQGNLGRLSGDFF